MKIKLEPNWIYKIHDNCPKEKYYKHKNISTDSSTDPEEFKDWLKLLNV